MKMNTSFFKSLFCTKFCAKVVLSLKVHTHEQFYIPRRILRGIVIPRGGNADPRAICVLTSVGANVKLTLKLVFFVC